MSAFNRLKMNLRRAAGRLHRDRPALITYLFHALFADAAQVAADHIAPQQAITVDHFRRFVEHYQRAGYRFVSPDDLDAGLDPEGRYVMATFDDGYFNNRLALDVLAACDVPAVFFISTGHVKTGRCFWWDVLHRHRHIDAGRTLLARRDELKAMPTDRVEAALREALGDDCLRPIGDVDRPFTPAELRDLAAHRLVHVGNHSVDHAILTAYSDDARREQITGCQRDLHAICGATPTIISYPNGDHDRATLDAAADAGLRWGITVAKHKNPLPLAGDPPARLTLGRFTLWGDRDIDGQCEVHRSDVGFTRTPAGGRGMSL